MKMSYASVWRLVAGLSLTGAGVFAGAQTPDPISDAVGTTTGEFRVDESGAATYSIPIVAVPGTAGVAPQVALSYSSRGGDGPLGRGWAISGLSGISRCRATREAGDFMSGGVPVDGDPPAVNFSESDRFCLDGERLLPAPSGAPVCKAVSGHSATNYRTRLETFQRVCAYMPNGSGNGPAFFSVERKDGSVSFYGNRNGWTTTANRPDGYVNSTHSLHTAKALSWWQTRFQDSTGNYIDYFYVANPGGSSYPGESLVSSIEYTGKLQLSGQSGGNLSPYARLMFNWAARPTSEYSAGEVAGGKAWQTRYLDSITVVGDIASNAQARHYALNYATSVSNSRARTLVSVTECNNNSQAVCYPPTTFAWTTAITSFSTTDLVTSQGFDGLVDLRLGDVDGDGLTDVVWFKSVNVSGCSKSHLYVSFGTLNVGGQLTFDRVTQTPWCIPRDVPNIGKAWHLFDYDGDGRDDLFVAGTGPDWALYLSLGRPSTGGNVFNYWDNRINGISIPITTIDNDMATLADLNGDGLLDVLYPRPTGVGTARELKVRLMERSGSNFAWGNERALQIETPSSNPRTFVSFYAKAGRLTAYDVDGDARADVAMQVTETISLGISPCSSRNIELEGPRDRDGHGVDLREAELWYRQVARSVASEEVSDRAINCYLKVDTVDFYGVSEITPSTVTMRARQSWAVRDQYTGGAVYNYNTDLKFADVNGDGLTDVVRKHFGTGWYASPTGFPHHFLGATFPNEDYLQLADINGDGRADIVFPQEANNSYRPFWTRRANPDGTFETTAAPIAGGNARGCRQSTCDLTHTAFLFSDFDGDATTDFVALYDNNTQHFSSRSPAASRYVPRDTIATITDGHGAQTSLHYKPLTIADVYRRSDGARALNWGRGSAVQEFMAPMYVVARAMSSAPVYGNASAMSTVYYRYQGARMQAGGGGFLGFAQVQSIDTTPSNQYIATTTTYRQDFPFVGMPDTTEKRVVPGAWSATTCAVASVSNNCFQPPSIGAFPAFGGTLISQATSLWGSSPAFAPGTQTPLHVRLSNTDERRYALEGGAMTGKVLTTFTHGSYGNVGSTAVDTYTGGGSPLSSVTTSNIYTDDTANWRLGRLTSSSVTHTRSGSSVTRSTSYAYDLAGAATGLLTKEHLQPGGGANQDLRTLYTLDAFGNRTHAYTCSNHLTDAACRSTAVSFHPGSAGAPNATIHRYARTTFDAIGRYPSATYGPFWNGSGTVERLQSQILSRNLLGQATHTRDAIGVDAIAVYGHLGRPYYTWAETVNTANPGNAADGVESWITYRRCGSAGNQVLCPVGAAYRQQMQSEGAPTQWSYQDVLGRPVLTVSQTRHLGTANKGFSGVCTAYDAAGRPVRVSNPFFLTSVASAVEPASFPTNLCTTARQWNLTTMDALGRVTAVQLADGSGTTTSYSGLITTGYDQNGHPGSQSVNALGEVVSSTDATGLTLNFTYTPDGNLSQVTRNAGRGLVTNTFGYDTLGRKTSQNDLDNGATSYEYNALGEVIAQVDGNNHRIERHLDARGRVWQEKAYRWTGSARTLENVAQFVFDTAPNGLGQRASESISGASSLDRTLSYDVLGRPIQRDTMTDGFAYREQTRYDTLGRAWKTQDASGQWTKQTYNTLGHPTQVCGSTSSDTSTSCSGSFYLSLEQADARGNITVERRDSGSGPTTTRTYDGLNGRLSGVCTGVGCTVQNTVYEYDLKGQVTRREQSGRYAERFEYDAADRLTLGWFESVQGTTYGIHPPVVNPDGTPPANLSAYVEYDKLGNTCRKYLLGLIVQYGYVGRSGCGLSGTGGSGTTNAVASAHQTMSLYGNNFYSIGNAYDSAGNMTVAGDRRTYVYDARRQNTLIYLDEASAPTHRTRFAYGPEGARYQRIDDGSAAGGTTTTTYIGNVEKRQLPGGAIQWRRHLGAVLIEHNGQTTSGGITVASGAGTVKHQFMDGLGSIEAMGMVSGASVTLLERYDYSAHGDRRSPSPPFGTATPTQTTHGFTGHEHVDALDSIHMNGRIYWGLAGRFGQTDPVVQQPTNPQNWNPYSYVLNNPLNHTDPSGNSFLSVLGHTATAWAIQNAGKHAIRSVMRGIGQDATGVAIGVGCGYAPSYWSVACAGGASYDMARAFGGSSSDARQAGVRGAFSALVFKGINDYYEGSYTGRIAVTAIAGGVVSVVNGGKFGHGFVSAGVSVSVAPALGNMNTFGGTVVSAIVGGTVSEMTGGKFANGAATAAMSYAMGQMARGGGGQRSGPGDGSGEATLKVGQSRPMTEGEIAMAQGIFDDNVDYSKVQVFNRKFRFFQQRGVAMAPNGNIYFHPADYMDDFSGSTMGNRAWFMHEMTHVWQHQQGINVYAAALDRRYDYRPLAPGKAFRSYGLEQQADIMQDYFLMRNGYQPQWSGHAIGEYEAILPFGRSP